MEDYTGSNIGGYLLLHRLGQGGSCSVYEAVDGQGSHCALKLLSDQVGPGALPQARSRLKREAAVLAGLDHLGLAPVLDLEVDGEHAFVVTELIQGPTLAQVVRSEGPLSAQALYEVAQRLYDTLLVVHGAHVVHRDVKPSNVILSERGAVLIDFGIALDLDGEELTRTGVVLGTPGYIAPEVLRGVALRDLTCVDWWGWVALLFFAFTGQPPFGAGPVDVVLGRVLSGSVQLNGLPVDVAGFWRSALHPDPDSRLSPEVVLDFFRHRAQSLATQDFNQEATEEFTKEFVQGSHGFDKTLSFDQGLESFEVSPLEFSVENQQEMNCQDGDLPGVLPFWGLVWSLVFAVGFVKLPLLSTMCFLSLLWAFSTFGLMWYARRGGASIGRLFWFSPAYLWRALLPTVFAGVPPCLAGGLYHVLWSYQQSGALQKAGSGVSFFGWFFGFSDLRLGQDWLSPWRFAAVFVEDPLVPVVIVLISLVICVFWLLPFSWPARMGSRLIVRSLFASPWLRLAVGVVPLCGALLLLQMQVQVFWPF